jgi:hypothetical protein
VPAALEVREQDLRDRLIRADFKERFMGDDQPPATHYELGEEDGAFYAEFLTPLIGVNTTGRATDVQRHRWVGLHRKIYVTWNCCWIRHGWSNCPEGMVFHLKRPNKYA